MHILRFSVQIYKGQDILKELSNLNGLTKIILLGLVRSHFLQIFGLSKKLKYVIKYIALKLSDIVEYAATSRLCSTEANA